MDKNIIAIKFPPSGKEIYFDDGSWTNDGATIRNLEWENDAVVALRHIGIADHIPAIIELIKRIKLGGHQNK